MCIRDREYGEGVDRMCKELEAVGLQAPEYRLNAFMLQTTIRNSTLIDKKPRFGEKNHGLVDKKPRFGEAVSYTHLDVYKRQDKYCKISEDNKEKESYFEMEIMLGEKYYAYGFEVILNQSKFVSEWLVELTADNKENLIFSRDIKNGVYEFGSTVKTKGLIDKLDVYAEDIQEDSSVLLLLIMNKNKKTLYQQYEGCLLYTSSEQ